MSNRILTKDAIFAADDTSRLEFVPCPEWGHVQAEEGTDPSLVSQDPGYEGVLLEVYEDAEGSPKKRKVSMGVNCPPRSSTPPASPVSTASRPEGAVAEPFIGNTRSSCIRP